MPVDPHDEVKRSIRMTADRLLLAPSNEAGERKSRAGILIPATANVDRRLGGAEVVAAGAPDASMPAGIVAPAATTDPAATNAPLPIVAPSSTTEPLATMHASSRSAPCTTQLWAIVTSGPTSVVSPGGPWMTALSCTF